MMAQDSREWKPAIYARLSKEDMEHSKKGVSLSIEHQIVILTDFVKEQGWPPPKVFYDDDSTGTNFNRKGFQAMYDEAQNGTDINVIVIKDTSRFGRNWVDSGVYFRNIEKMGVRFISIQESIDTADPHCPGLKMLPFYFIFNEWHSATTSEKIRTVLNKQAEQGKYRASRVLFGYDKDPNDKYKLIIDPPAAEVVRRIFEMRMQKFSYGAIARVLNSDGIPSPSEYHALRFNTKNKRSYDGKWASETVDRVLGNLAYCGDIARNRSGTKDYIDRRAIHRPKEEWIITENMHEPIVSREIFDKCAAMRINTGRVRRTKESEIRPFASLLVCADCGYKLVQSYTSYTLRTTGEKVLVYGFNCGTFNSKGKDACTSHYISEKSLSALVIADIREKAGQVLKDESAARERFYTIKAQSSGTKLNADKTALKRVSKRLDELDRLMQAAFEKSVLGGEASELFLEYARKYEAEKQELTKQVGQLTASIEQQSRTESDVETFIALMKKFADVTELDRATVVELIDRITVLAEEGRPREIEIHYNLIGKTK